MTAIRNTVLLLTALITGCVDDGQGPAPEPPPNPIATLQATLQQSVEGAILPAVDSFLAGVEAMEGTASTFCSAPDEAQLATLQARWRTAFERWYRLSLYNFGPLDDDFVFPAFTFIDSLRLRGTDYIETVRSEIADDIDSDRELTVEYFSGKTFQRVGLLALESLIFETATAELSRESADIVADYQFQPRKCDVLLGVAGALRERASYVEQGWKVAFRGEGEPFQALFLTGQLEDGTEPVSQILISSQEFLDYLQARSVVITAGQVSDHAWPAISATIDEVELLLRGEPLTSGSLFDFMEEAGALNEIAAVEDSISQVRAAIAARDPDMLEVTLGFLDGNFKRELPDSLEIDLGINFSDGD